VRRLVAAFSQANVYFANSKAATSRRTPKEFALIYSVAFGFA
jgi:hypothetical protein